MPHDPRCQCPFAISMTGEGCRYCQPQNHIDQLHEILADNENDLAEAEARIDQLIKENAEIWGRYNLAEQRLARAKAPIPPKAEWRKRVQKWANFLDDLKNAPLPRGQRDTAASIKKQIDRYIEHGRHQQLAQNPEPFARAQDAEPVGEVGMVNQGGTGTFKWTGYKAPSPGDLLYTRPPAANQGVPEGFCLDGGHRTLKANTGKECSCPKYVRHPHCTRYESRGLLPGENPWITTPTPPQPMEDE